MTPASASSTSAAYSGTRTMKSAPSTAPETVARPPTTTAARKPIDSVTVNDSGDTPNRRYISSDQ